MASLVSPLMRALSVSCSFSSTVKGTPLYTWGRENKTKFKSEECVNGADHSLVEQDQVIMVMMMMMMMTLLWTLKIATQIISKDIFNPYPGAHELDDVGVPELREEDLLEAHLLERHVRVLVLVAEELDHHLLAVVLGLIAVREGAAGQMRHLLQRAIVEDIEQRLLGARPRGGLQVVVRVLEALGLVQLRGLRPGLERAQGIAPGAPLWLRSCHCPLLPCHQGNKQAEHCRHGDKEAWQSTTTSGGESPSLRPELAPSRTNMARILGFRVIVGFHRRVSLSGERVA
jgi:hypothetical protein